MSTLALALALHCPVGTIDRIDGQRMTVLGTSGVTVVASPRVALRGPEFRAPREGDRLELGRDGHCHNLGPDPEISREIQQRLRVLRRP